MAFRIALLGIAPWFLSVAVLTAQTTTPGAVNLSSPIVQAHPAPTLIGGAVLGLADQMASRPLPPAVKGQPYSLVRTTTNVQTLGDGTKITRVVEEHEMRDSEGRTRDEHGHLKDGQFNADNVFLTDPVAQTRTSLMLRSKTAIVTHSPEPKPLTLEQQATRNALRNQAATRRQIQGVSERPEVEKLPPQTIAGVYAEGTRMTHVIPAGSVGNDRDITTVMETWWSPDLNIMLNTCFDDPRTPKNTTVITNLQRIEPASQLFEIPADFKVTTRPVSATEPPLPLQR